MTASSGFAARALQIASGFEAQSLNVQVDFPLFQKIALPVMAGKTKIAGIKIHDIGMMWLMEVLRHGGTQLNGWRSVDIQLFALTRSTYTVTERYDLPQDEGPLAIERIGRG